MLQLVVISLNTSHAHSPCLTLCKTAASIDLESDQSVHVMITISEFMHVRLLNSWKLWAAALRTFSL